jgi:hypothetical protein
MNKKGFIAGDTWIAVKPVLISLALETKAILALIRYLAALGINNGRLREVPMATAEMFSIFLAKVPTKTSKFDGFI